jgi:ABC-type antimicrobial peptide transport system permease subunit
MVVSSEFSEKFLNCLIQGAHRGFSRSVRSAVVGHARTAVVMTPAALVVVAASFASLGSIHRVKMLRYYY